jgi:hypothetical protein
MKPRGFGVGGYVSRDVELKRGGVHDDRRVIAVMTALMSVTYRDPQDQAVAQQ